MGQCKKGKPEGECCGGCSGHAGEHVQEIDVSALGPEAVELAKLFDDVNSNLVSALKARARILQLVHEKSAQSPEMKEKIDKVLSSRHPVLMQFIFGQ